MDCLGLQHVKVDAAVDQTRPVIFCGPYEHHSNLLPWRESGCEICMVPERDGKVDLDALERSLKKFQSRPLKVGTFTAASNITGKITEENELCALLHKYGALACFDYATGAPYMKMNMNPVDSTGKYTPDEIAKDAIFFSGHKLMGGIGTPGVLIVKKKLVTSTNPPARSGGGTVFYVTQTHHRFLSNRIERYEGGTPNVAGIFRLGICLKAKRDAERAYELIASKETSLPPTLLDYEFATYRRVSAFFRDNVPNLCPIDDGVGNHLPIFSFLIKCGKRFLHYNYVCALLNDVFGIQSRGGCQCAGPYSQKRLGLTDGPEDHPNKINEQVEHALVHSKERAELLRPGFTRLSLPFKGVDRDQEEYVCKAIAWVAQYGWILLPSYRCNHRTGEWRHKSRQGAPLGKKERHWLSHYHLLDKNKYERPPTGSVNSTKSQLSQAMENADKLLEAAKTDASGIQQALKMTDEDMGANDDAIEALRWYVYPKEVAKFLAQGKYEIPGTLDRSNLVGALRPLSWYPKKEAPTLPKPELTDAVIDAIQGDEEDMQVTPEQSPKADSSAISATDRLFFRDGEFHSGEAPWVEIQEGYHEGELTTNCEIFHAESDDWVQIDEFIRLLKGEDTTPTETVPADMGVDDVQETEVSAALPKIENLPKDEKNQKKKPARDSSNWGTGTFNPVKPEVQAQGQAAITKVPVVPSNGKRKRHKHIKPPSKLMRLVTQAMIQWNMIEEGDRLLLGLSGGKDSLTLLHVLLEFQKKLPTKFEIEVCTIDPMTPSFDPSPLIPYVESLGLKYHYIRDNIVERAENSGKNGEMVKSLCAYCARMKRGNLYTCARENNCNKLVLAQHLDDMAESFMMSLMHNAFLRTMKANYEINAGDLSVIRPLAYCRESLMTEFAKSVNLPVINENCPACFEEPKERARMKKLLSREEALYPNLYENIKRSILPLMHDESTAILRCYTEETLAKSRRDPKQPKKRPNGQDNNNAKKAKWEDAASENEIETPAISSSLLAEASEEELIRELARRKATKYRLAGSMQKNLNKEGQEDGAGDPTGQVCTVDGKNGTIRCYELME